MRSSIRTATRGMRIMSADVVPGVAKSARNGGGQVTQKDADGGGDDRLKQMVAQQAAAKKNAVIEAQLRTRSRRRWTRSWQDARPARDDRRPARRARRPTTARSSGRTWWRALRRRRMLLDDGERPLRLLFAGPSGVGKTAMATALCEAVFGAAVPDRNFKRFNLPSTRTRRSSTG